MLASVRGRRCPSAVEQRRKFIIQQLPQHDSIIPDEGKIILLATLIPDESVHALNVPDLGWLRRTREGWSSPTSRSIRRSR
jgi:hypothetical protein